MNSRISKLVCIFGGLDLSAKYTTSKIWKGDTIADPQSKDAIDKTEVELD